MMKFLIHVRPEEMYRFSTRKCLPPPSVRFNKKVRPLIPFEIIEARTSDIPRMKEANIVLRGSSFSIKDMEKLNPPIFLVSFWEPIETKKDVNYAMGRSKCALWLGKMGYQSIFIEVNEPRTDGRIEPTERQNWRNPWYEDFIDDGTSQRISLVQRVYRKHKRPLWAPTNSGLAGISAIYHLADKINIYGWDYYLDSSPDLMNYWEFFSQLYHLKPDITLTRTHLESSMINYYYAYHLSKLPNVNIYGGLGNLSRHGKLIGKIERALW